MGRKATGLSLRIADMAAGLRGRTEEKPLASRKAAFL